MTVRKQSTVLLFCTLLAGSVGCAAGQPHLATAFGFQGYKQRPHQTPFQSAMAADFSAHGNYVDVQGFHWEERFGAPYMVLNAANDQGEAMVIEVARADFRGLVEAPAHTLVILAFPIVFAVAPLIAIAYAEPFSSGGDLFGAVFRGLSGALFAPCYVSMWANQQSYLDFTESAYVEALALARARGARTTENNPVLPYGSRHRPRVPQLTYAFPRFSW